MIKNVTAYVRKTSIIFLFITSILLMITPFMVYGQTISGFFDNFNRSSLDTLWNGHRDTLWVSDFPHTYFLSDTTGGVLNITYTRDSQSGQWDEFNFTPPANIDVSQNPKITMDIKSSVTTVYSIKPIYSNGKSGWIQKNIPGDNTWHSYTFNLVSSNYTGATLNKIFMYFDGGTTTPKSGDIQFDNFKIAGFTITISNLKASVVDSNHVDLSWSVDKPSATQKFNIYRSAISSFVTNSSTLVGDTTATVYHDRGLKNNTVYYYKVAAVDTAGEIHTASQPISIQTFQPGLPPAIQIDSTNAASVPKYEKFQVTFSLKNTAFQNPYNPQQIDVHAYFKSPKGDTTWVNGFYNNYENANVWEIRFAPTETGTWEYQIYAKDAGGIGKSTKGTFKAITSNQHGWLTTSPENANYLAYTDSTPFYGIAAYYPWNVTQSGLDQLKDSGINIIGYWNSTYDNAGNGGGVYLIESMRSGLGHYDQQKCGRIDQLLSWLKARNMKMMFAVWPHDYLDANGKPWPNGKYTSENPYSSIVSAGNFYADSLAWVHQKRLYRYIIARWGYSENLGIWEIVNELQGTTGYVDHPDQAIEWVNKVDDYFKSHDPHKRPTTASYGSSKIWSIKGSINPDIIANRHYYEAQGYATPFSNSVRNGLYDVVNEITNLKNGGKRPAFFGEAGYTSMFSPANSFNYTYEMHNAFWAGLSDGLASTPFWWDFTTKSVFTPGRLAMYSKIKSFADSLDLPESPDSKLEISAKGSYAYGLKNNHTAFGWLYDYENNSITGKHITITGLNAANYALSWYDTWTGKYVKVDTTVSAGYTMKTTVPQQDSSRKDIAFRVKQLPAASNATALHIFFKQDSLISTTNGHYAIVVYVTNNKGLLVTSANPTINFKLSGPGSLSATSVKATNGVAIINYNTPTNLSGGNINISAEANGLTSASLSKIVTDIQSDNKTSLPTKFKLEDNYPNPFNPTTNIKYSLSKTAHVELKVYNILGQLVATLVNHKEAAGKYMVTFHADKLSSGVYLYRLKAGSFVATKKMTLLK